MAAAYLAIRLFASGVSRAGMREGCGVAESARPSRPDPVTAVPIPRDDSADRLASGNSAVTVRTGWAAGAAAA
ncbi:hypothetical protein, partial [Azospirillum brasilense]|uniref:hypothetical protein n=1 Tax=Azospirillum brasilense TaxID=192 RepID=UPI000556F7B4